MLDPTPVRPSLLQPRLWPVWCAVGFMWVLARLPMAWIFAIGQAVGWLGYHLARSRRHNYPLGLVTAIQAHMV